jgi:4-diphosphocytidyl-2-C-methyl-D-erythritol kinase
MAADLGRLHNDLEPAAIALRPVIGDVLAEVAATPGCLLARMSGSGATCFGLYRDSVAARVAMAELQKPGRWCWAGPLRRG